MFISANHPTRLSTLTLSICGLDNGVHYSFFEKTLAERVVSEDEVDIRSRSLRLHTRISELLQIAMKE
jgi:hypothetical protein